MTATPNRRPTAVGESSHFLPPPLPMYERTASFEYMEYMQHQRTESDLRAVLEQVSEMSLDLTDSSTSSNDHSTTNGSRFLTTPAGGLRPRHSFLETNTTNLPPRFRDRTATSSNGVVYRGAILPRKRSNSFLLHNAPSIPSSPDLADVPSPPTSFEKHVMITDSTIDDAPMLPTFGSPVVERNILHVLKMRKADNTNTNVFP